MFQLSSFVQRCICILSALAVVCQPTTAAWAQASAKSLGETRTASTIKDVALNSQGQFKLYTVDQTGHRVGNVPVTVAFKGKEVARAKSDADGTVVITGLRPGLHSVVSLNSSCVYRFWSPEQAPPSCVKKPALTVVKETTRGQYGPMMGYPMQPMMGPGMMAPGLLATGITAAAVVVVLVGKNSGDDAVVIPPPASP